MILPTIYKVSENNAGGFLAIMAKPMSGEWIDDEFSGLSNMGVTVLVSLLEVSEACDVGLQAEQHYCEKNGIRFVHYPIPDRGVPSNKITFEKLVVALSEFLRQGNGVVIHCRAGIGRSGLLAACVLVRREKGVSVEKAIERISTARRVVIPDTEEQCLWIDSHIK